MKKTQFLEWIRNIRKTWITFLSIAVIAALGIAVYLGINYASEGLKETNNKLYQDQKFWDFKIMSALGFDEEDVENISKFSRISQIAGTYETDGKVKTESQDLSVTFVALTENISEGSLLEGSMPKESTECTVSQKWAESQKIKVGDTLKVTASNGGKDCLKAPEYKVVGISDYIGATKGNGIVQVPAEAFNTEAFNGYYTAIYIRIKNADGYSTYGGQYEQLKEEVKLKLEKDALTFSKNHYDDIIMAIQNEIDKNEKKLSEGRAKLDSAKAELEKAQKELKDGEQKLAQAQKELSKGQKKITEEELELAKGHAKLEEGYAQLTAGREKLDAGWQELWAIETQVQDTMTQKEDELIAVIETAAPGSSAAHRQEMEAKIEACIKGEDSSSAAEITEYFMDINGIEDEITRTIILRQVEDMGLEAELAESRSLYQQYQAAIDTLNNGEAAYAAGYEEYTNGLNLYNEKVQELADGKAEYQTGLQEYEEGKQKLSEGKAALESSTREYEAGEKEYAESKEMLDEEKENAEAIKYAHWIILDRNSIPSYDIVLTNAENLKSLGLTIALTFIIVAALVCYSSISRMIEEQRKLLGVQKANGFFSKEIFVRYMGYALFSTAVGTLLGILTAYFIIQPMILNIYKNVNGFSSMETSALPATTAIVALTAFIIAAAAVWMACSHLLKLPAVNLMKEEAPTGGKNFLSGFRFYQKLPLFTKVMIGNMFSDKRRVITTLAGVAGCMTLLVAGFSLKMAANEVPQLQYSQIQLYQKVLSVKSSMEEEAREQIEKKVAAYGGSCAAVSEATHIYKLGGTISEIKLVGTQPKDIKGFLNIKDAYSGKDMEIPEKGILLNKGTAEKFGLSVGDNFPILDTQGNTYDLEISGIFMNYFGEQILLHKDYYKQAVGKEMPNNRYYIKLAEADSSEELQKALSGIKGVVSYKNSANAMGIFNSLSGTLDSILALLIFMSAVMAVMILLNLFLMHIRQKSRELAVMRVNGFTLKETKRYVGTETMVITMIGILIGIVLGSLLEDVVRRMLQNQILQIKAGAQPLAWLISAVITMVFSMLVNSIALSKIKKLKLNNVSANE